MRINGSKQLVKGEDGLYVVIGRPDDGYDLYLARLDHRGTFKRKWQAVAAARGEDGAS